MATTTFTNGVTLTDAAWFNDVDALAYQGTFPSTGLTNLNPDSDDGAAIGTSGTAWSDLFLATGAVIDFNAGNITLTHAAGTLVFTGGTLDINGNELILDADADTSITADTDDRIDIKIGGADAFQLHPFATGGTSFFRKNAIINGEFNIWQRGTSFAAIASVAYSADRWQYSAVGTAVHTVSRSTDVPTVAEAGRLFNYSVLVDCTTIDASIAAGDYVAFQQQVEGYNFLPLAQKACTLSFWVKGTKTGIYCVALGNSGSDRSYVAEYTINTTATWEKKTVTFTASPSAGTWDYTTGMGLRLYFILACGSTYHTTADAWQTGNFIATSNQVNATDDAANDFQLCGVQLEPGSVATEFEQRTFNEELALCQRYYEKTFEYGTAPAQASNTTGQLWMAAPNTSPATNWQYKVTKRAVPTIVSYNPTQANANWRNTADSGDATFVASDNGMANLAASATSATDGVKYRIHLTSAAEL